ncbi:MAG: MYXO-CTERM sorting domain-containing protein, partial [Polyangiaceae bacterium]
LELTTMTRENAPRLGLRLGSDLDDGRQAIEWQYKVDSGPWSPFTTARAVDIVDPWLRAQGRHYVRVRSRVVGDVYSLDADPERLEILVDTKAPHITLDRDVEGPPRLRVSDAVSPEDATSVRLRYGERGDDGTMQWDTWSAWHPASAFERLDGGDATHVEVEARDESENVGQIQQPLLRGKAVADAAGCQCLVGSRPAPSNPAAWWSILGLAAAAMFRRRRRQEQPQSASPPRLSQSIRPVTIALFLLASGGWAGCSCSETTGGLEAGCRGRGDCEVLLPGLVGGYSSAEVNAKGELWVSGYLEGNWFDDYSYGDLVVGRYDGQRVDWIVIDGVPNEPAVDLERYDIKGFRRGQTEYGDDVGLWTSLAFNSGDEPAVAYYDRTNRALRYANRRSGVWQTATVAQASGTDVGRYAKLLMVGGKPVIAYQFSEAQPDGSIHSGVRLAHGSTVDAADASWTHEDVVSDATTPCRAYLCASGTRCVKSNGRCEASSQDCATDCDDGLKCVTVGGEPTCEAVDAPAALVTYPDAVGLYVSAALTPEGQIGLAYYDRLRGNLMVATPNADGYTTLIADGEADGQSTGDRGIGSSLAIDAAGDYHIAYVDGLAERLMYVRVNGGTTPATPEAVDDGLSVDGTPHPDKQHIVGDDPHLTVASSGDVQISYQDASAGTLRFATGSVNGDAHDWARKLIPQDGFGGFFSRQVQYDGSLAITNFWRVASPQAQGDVRVLRP